MAKQLLGKEVTAALNEKIIGQVKELKEKGVPRSLALSALERDRTIFLMRPVQPRDVIPLVWK